MNNNGKKSNRPNTKIIAFVMIHLLFFANCCAAVEEVVLISREIEFEKLSPSINIEAPSVKDIFNQTNIAEKGDLSGFKNEVINSNKQSHRLFNVNFVADIALNPRLMASVKESEFKQAMLTVLRSRAKDLKIAYLKAVESFVNMDENNSLDIQVMGEIANLILKDNQVMEIKLRAIRALAAIAVRQPQFKEQMELMIINSVNERVSVAKKRRTPYHFLVFQAQESLLEMGADVELLSNLEPMNVDLTNATEYMRRVLLTMINYIDNDQKRNNKPGRVARVYAKQNSFTDGLWLFGSDIDGLVIHLEDVSSQDRDRYERVFDYLFTDAGVAGANAQAVERPYWKSDPAERIAKIIPTSEIVLYDVNFYTDTGADSSQWSPLKQGWAAKNENFRTEKSKLRKLFIDLIDANKDAEEVLDNFLVRDETILSSAEKKRIKEIFNDPEKAKKVRELLKRMHFIAGTGEVFYESHGQSEMVVGDLYETLEFLRIIEKIADESGDQLVRTREIITWNDSKEFHVYPLWFMYTKGALNESTEGIKIVGRNGNRLVVNDNNIFVLPFADNGDLGQSRVASLADVKVFVGANKTAVYDTQGRTITLVEGDSFAYNMVSSNPNLRLVFFDADGDISFLGNSQSEAEQFKAMIGQSNIFANLLNKDRMLLAQDADTRADLIAPQVFSSFLKTSKKNGNEQNIMIIPSGEDKPVSASPEQLAEFVGSMKQAIFDVTSRSIILVEDTWTVNERIGNNGYRYFFFDPNGDISLFVDNDEEAGIFESIIRNSEMLGRALKVDQKLIVKNINTVEDLKDPVDFFDLIGRNALSDGNQMVQATVSDVVDIGPNSLNSIMTESVITNVSWVDQAI